MMNQKEIEAVGKEEYALWRDSKDRVHSIKDFMVANMEANNDRIFGALNSDDPADMLEVFGPGGGIAGVISKPFKYIAKELQKKIKQGPSGRVLYHKSNLTEAEKTVVRKSLKKRKDELYTQNNPEKVALKKKEWTKKQGPDYGKQKYWKDVKKSKTHNKRNHEKHKTERNKARKEKYATDPVFREKRLKDEQVRRQNNPELKAAQDKNWRENNPIKKAALSAKERADRINRTPKWLTKTDKKEIEKVYKLRNDLTIATGTKHHVDHVIPLRAKNVSGLHVPSNLQVLKGSENTSKGARINLDDIEKMGREAYKRTVQQREWLKNLKGE